MHCQRKKETFDLIKDAPEQDKDSRNEPTVMERRTLFYAVENLGARARIASWSEPTVDRTAAAVAKDFYEPNSREGVLKGSLCRTWASRSSAFGIIHFPQRCHRGRTRKNWKTREWERP